MSAITEPLKNKLDRIGRVKRAASIEDTHHFLALDPGARLVATLSHCDAHIAAFGTGPDRSPALETEAETWRRMRLHLAGRR